MNDPPPAHLDLFGAIEDGDARALALLINAGCDIATQGRAECLRQLIDAGCDLGAASKRARTASSLASEGHRHCLALIESELERRALGQDTPAPAAYRRAPRM